MGIGTSEREETASWLFGANKEHAMPDDATKRDFWGHDCGFRRYPAGHSNLKPASVPT
jgi:hypothetical protein